MPVADLDRLLTADYLGDVRARPLAEIRSMRAECQAAESKVSYLRRLVQGRLDIVVSEQRSRDGGGPPTDTAALVAALPRILSDRLRAPAMGPLAFSVTPPDDEELTADLDELAGPDILGSLPEMSDDEVRHLAERLHALEAEVSSQRRSLFGVIDALTGELARRYEEGEADPAFLLR